MSLDLSVNFSYAGSICSGKLFEEGYILYDGQKHTSATGFIEYVTKDSELTNFYMDRVYFDEMPSKYYNGIVLGDMHYCGYFKDYKNDDSDRLAYLYSILKDDRIRYVREHVDVTSRSNDADADYEDYIKKRALKNTGEILEYLGKTLKNIGVDDKLAKGEFFDKMIENVIKNMK